MQTGIYRHHKGGHYLVLGVARHSETGEELVVYVSLYPPPDGGGAMHARPRRMFEGTVTQDGKAVPRFRHVGEGLAPAEPRS